MRFNVLLVLMVTPLLLTAQSTPPPRHIQEVAPVVVALTNATLHTDAFTTLPKATLLLRDGRVVAAGAQVTIPAGAEVRDLKGLHIWPALIDPYSDLGLPASTTEERKAEATGSRHWNDALRSDFRAHTVLRTDADRAAKLREQGFATVITHRMDGIARGTSCALHLRDEPAAEVVLASDVAAHFSLRKGSATNKYPSSQMGAIALLRQALLDAQWQARTAQRTTDPVLEALARQLPGRVVVEANDRNELLRWNTLLKPFGVTAIVRSGGDEYARLADVKATGMPLLLPLQLPDAYDVADPYDAQEVSFARLKHWELAPFNPALVDSVAIPFAFTAHGRKDLKDLWKDLRRMVACGLDSARAIDALTAAPARLFGLENEVGTLAPGRSADLLITSHHLLDAKNTIHETWVAGRRHVLRDPDLPPLAGTFDLNLGDAIWALQVKVEPGKAEATMRLPGEADSLAVKVDLQQQGSLINLRFARRDDAKAITRLSGTVHGAGSIWDGQGQRPGGQWFHWSAVRQADSVPRAKRDSTASEPPVAHGAVLHPLVGFGWSEAPQPSTIIFRKATVWTNTDQGILRNTDVCVHQGKVLAVGEDLRVEELFPGKVRPVVTEIDAKGRHLTTGIVDEHSHIAISRGVNEGARSISSEVRIADVVDPDDINIYRNLAGGVTTVQLLHGSANPIGGQSALIKLRWGLAADSLLIRDAAGHIKFALGENVKQSNWGPGDRFPRSRMGVEQQFYDAFHRAKEYDTTWRSWNSLRPKDRDLRNEPRRDLQLEALAEILRGERHITCHSYVQSEIDMLMHVADSMGFTVNTFTHILEGYKMARKMQEHGVSASTFSDWWAYKFEVYDAIPYNAALLHAQGVNTGINSDDAEMSRRLNQEAAKAIKYGGVSPEEAWKMVTLNPARMLKLDHRIGRVAPGMDADLVLWSADPLSIQARVERTYVDGVCYFDRVTDLQRRTWAAAERDRIVRAMIAAQADGAPTRKARRERKHLWHCDDLGEEGHEGHDQH
ncbi:MAG: amidohydrolase family protein [Flavobacteriales bacterium]